MKTRIRIKNAGAKTIAGAPGSTGPKPVRAVPTKATTADGQDRATSARSQPELLSVRFELDVLGARTVSVVGTFNNWSPGAIPLIPQGGSKWLRDIPLAPGYYEYRFVVDGRWTDDPKAKAYAANPHGGRNAIVTPDRFG